MILFLSLVEETDMKVLYIKYVIGFKLDPDTSNYLEIDITGRVNIKMTDFSFYIQVLCLPS